MPKATITSKGQVTIPKEIREKMKLHAGDKVHFEIKEDGSIRIRHSDTSILDRAGALRKYAKKESVSIEEMNEAIKEAAVERFKRNL